MLTVVIRFKTTLVCASLSFSLAQSGASAACADARSCDDVKPAALLELLSRGSLNVTARVTYGDEDEESEPIADARFYLLDQDFIRLLKEAGFEPPDSNDGKKQQADADYLRVTALTLFESQLRRSCFHGQLTGSTFSLFCCSLSIFSFC